MLEYKGYIGKVELDEKATCKGFLQVQTDGNKEVSRKQKVL